MIAAERRRQIEVEGYNPQDDKLYNADQLSRAAAAYLAFDTVGLPDGRHLWPWDASSFKPSARGRSDGYWTRGNAAARVRDLTKAGALIAAEIDRLQSLNLGDDQP